MTLPSLTLPTYEDVVTAAQRLSGKAHRTPVQRSAHMEERLGAKLFFKCENMQRTGAFKFRGAYNRISRLTPEEKRRGVVAFSSGTHAQGVAAAAALAGAAALIVMPSDSPRVKVDGVIAFGGEVRL